MLDMRAAVVGACIWDINLKEKAKQINEPNRISRRGWHTIERDRGEKGGLVLFYCA